MRFYKKIIIGIVAIALLVGGGYSAYLTFFKSEDLTISITLKKETQHIYVKDLKIPGFTHLYGFYDNKVIGQFIDDKINKGAYSVGIYDIANNKIHYIENDKSNYVYNWGSKIPQNGNNILYNAGKHGKRNTFSGEFGLYDVSTNKNKRIVIKKLNNIFPASLSLDPWSENGIYAALAMSADTIGITNILIYDTNTGRHKDLKSNSFTKLEIYNTKVSNDGKRLYFSAVNAKKNLFANKKHVYFAAHSLFSVNIDNVKDVREEDKNVNSDWFYLSKDSKSAIYSRINKKKCGNVIQKFFCDYKGRKEKVLIKNCNLFSISPNGRKIAYLDDSSGLESLYIADVMWKNGNAKVCNKKLAYKAQFTDVPYWSNDNSSIAIRHGNSIYVIGLIKQQ